MNDKLKNWLYECLITGLHAILISILIESVHRWSILDALKWLSSHSLEFLFITLLLFLLLVTFRIFNKKMYYSLSLICLLLFGILAFASYTKQSLRGDPLLPSDLLLVNEARNMLDFFSESIPYIYIIVTILLIIVLAFVIYKIPKGSKRNLLHFISSPLIFLLLVLMVSQEINHTHTLINKLFSIQTDNENQVANYDKNGVLTSFIKNVKVKNMDEPNKYTKRKIDEIINDIDRQPELNPSPRKPNIIVVMSEAFWDPTIIDSITFNKDPLPNFHALSESHTSGTVLTPVFGGSTANTEFEFLTGLSMQFLSNGSVPYQHNIDKPIPALPHILKNNGYKTIALHSYHNWFYKRYEVYKYLGFDNFNSIEFFEKPEPDAMYTRDTDITKFILNQIKQSDTPNFIFAVTMQNHGPYKTDAKKYYASMEITDDRTNGTLTKDSTNIIEFLADNLYDIDQDFNKFITELNELDEETMVVFFGDHLPLLGDNYKAYRETGYYKDDKSYEEYLKMHSTPLLIWDNFSTEKEEIHLGTSFLGAYILQRAGIEGTYLTDFLNNQRQNGMYNIPRLDYVDDANLDTRDLLSYEYLQYDILFGNMYGIENQSSIQPSKEYRLGMVDPKINKVTSKVEDDVPYLLIEGKNFTVATKAFIDDNEVETYFENGERLRAFYTPNKNNEEVVLKIVDSTGKSLAKSNTYKFPQKQETK
ncbi:LTA synthase family protein [Ferdinandcohnia sp. Marseille-Q9671]